MSNQRWYPLQLDVREDAPTLAQQMTALGRPFKAERMAEFQRAADAILLLEQMEVIDRAEFVRLRTKLATRVDGHSQGLNMKGVPLKGSV